jgi:hypothetical protein
MRLEHLSVPRVKEGCEDPVVTARITLEKKKLCIFPTECFYVFHMKLRVKKDCFSKSK